MGTTATCPKCSFSAPDEFAECPACGIVVSKFLDRLSPRHSKSSRVASSAPLPQPPPTHREGAASSVPEGLQPDLTDASTVEGGGTLYDPSQHVLPSPEPSAQTPRTSADEHSRLTESRHRALKLGIVVGVAVFLFPLTRFIFSYLLIIVHELGHTASALLFGIPAVPALDFFYGGGVSLMWDRSILLSLTVVAAGMALLWRVRSDPRSLRLGIGCALLWITAFLTPLHDVIILAMGHGAELLFAGYAWHRCLTGHCRNETERWLYGACSVFVLLSAWLFGYKLLASALFRRQYEQAKGGGHWMDFSRIAEQHLHVDLSVVAAAFWLLTAATPVVAYWVWINTDETAKRPAH